MNDGNYQPAPGPYGQCQGQSPYPPQGYGYPSAPYEPPSGYGHHPDRAPSSGLRVAAGILGIVLGLFEFVAFGTAVRVTRFYPWMGFVSFLCLVAALGCITTGIILLAKHRGRKKTVPILLLVFCGLATFTILVPVATAGIDIMSILVTLCLAVPAIILLSKALSREAQPPGFGGPLA
jgi:hypothetical protein